MSTNKGLLTYLLTRTTLKSRFWSRFQETPGGLWRWTISQYPCSGKVHLVSLWPWPLTFWPQSVITFVPNCTKVVNLVKLVLQVVCEVPC